MMTRFDKAAIIGYWRSGADEQDILRITNYSLNEIEITIHNYKLNQNEQQCEKEKKDPSTIQ